MSDLNQTVRMTHAAESRVWSSMRLDIQELLQTRAAPLVELYQAAVFMAHQREFPARGALIAHCVREISNSLPSYLGAPTKQRVDYSSLVNSLLEPWRDAGLPFGNDPPPIPIDDPRNQIVTSVPVPHHVVRKVSALLLAHEKGTATRRENAEIIFRELIGHLEK
jgi:hypothetical protein